MKKLQKFILLIILFFYCTQVVTTPLDQLTINLNIQAAVDEAEGKCNSRPCGASCNQESGFRPGICDGEGQCRDPLENPCAQHGCRGKLCGEKCLAGDILGICNVKGDCDLDQASNFCGVQGIVTDNSEKEIQNNESVANKNSAEHHQDYALKKKSRKKSSKVAKRKMKKSSKKSSKKTENDFVSDDEKKRPSLPCGGPVSDDVDDTKVPDTEEYSNTGYDRGHLLSSQMFRHYFPGKAAAVTEASNFMSNIWAQQPKCNRDKSSPWRKLEKDIADACRQCIKGGGNFLVSHGLIPDKEKIEGEKDIQKVKLAVVNYCCKVKEAVDESSVHSFTVNNPPKGEKCTGTNSTNDGVKAINKEYKDALKTITDLNLGETFPFEMEKECIVGFKSKYEFPSEK